MSSFLNHQPRSSSGLKSKASRTGTRALYCEDDRSIPRWTNQMRESLLSTLNGRALIGSVNAKPSGSLEVTVHSSKSPQGATAILSGIALWTVTLADCARNGSDLE